MARGYKTGGREQGVPNKITKKLRQRISDFLEQKWEVIARDFDQLEPKDRVMLFEKLLQYSIPRLQSTELKTNDSEIDSDTLRRARARMEAIADEGKD